MTTAKNNQKSKNSFSVKKNIIYRKINTKPRYKLPQIQDLICLPKKVSYEKNINRGSFVETFAPIFQFDFRSGVSTISNFGEIENPNIDYANSQFTYIANVFTGKAPVLIWWVDSCILKQDTQNINEFIADTFIGWTKIGKIISISSNTEIGNNQTDETLLNMSSTIDVQMEINILNQMTYISGETVILENDTLTEWDDYDTTRDERRLYLLPTIAKNVLFYISEHSYTTENGHKIHTITFSSLRDKLQKSGRALEQYVNYGLSIGSWYTYPKVDISSKLGISIKLDETALVRYPINAMKLRIFGNTAFSNIMFFGRPIYRSDMFSQQKRVRAPRHIAPFEYLAIPEYTLDRIENISENLTCIYDGETAIVWNDEGWKKDSPLNQIVSQTSLTDNQGQLIWSANSDIKIAQFESYEAYYNTTYIIFKDPIQKTLSFSFYWDASDVVDKKVVINYSNKDTFYTTNWKNHFIYSQNLSLTPTTHHTTQYSLSETPIIGKFFNMLGIGNLVWNTKVYHNKMNDLILFIDAYVINAFNLKQLTQNNKQNALTLSTFNNTDDMNKLFGANTKSISINGRLTDKLRKRGEDKYANTLYIGQYQDEKGVDFNLDGSIFKVSQYDLCERNENKQPEDEDVVGYEIDYIICQAINMGDMRISFYYEDRKTLEQTTELIPIFSTLIQSQSKYSGSILDWTTRYRCNGYLNEIMMEQEPTSYPRGLQSHRYGDYDPSSLFSCNELLKDYFDKGKTTYTIWYRSAYALFVELIQSGVSEIHIPVKKFTQHIPQGIIDYSQILITYTVSDGSNTKKTTQTISIVNPQDVNEYDIRFDFRKGNFKIHETWSIETWLGGDYPYDRTYEEEYDMFDKNAGKITFPEPKIHIKLDPVAQNVEVSIRDKNNENKFDIIGDTESGVAGTTQPKNQVWGHYDNNIAAGTVFQWEGKIEDMKNSFQLTINEFKLIKND